jgi:hypothetical protein
MLGFLKEKAMSRQPVFAVACLVLAAAWTTGATAAANHVH